MLDKITERVDGWVLGTLFFLGCAAGALRLLVSKRIAPRGEVIARSVLTGLFAMGAAAVYVPYPDASPVAVLGVGGLLASLGVSGVQRLVTKWKGGSK